MFNESLKSLKILALLRLISILIPMFTPLTKNFPCTASFRVLS